jgi:chromosome segregation ATPase
MAVLMILGLYGCTVMQLRNEVKTDEARLASKADELEIEEARQAQLQQEITRLKSDLATRQMSLDDLKVRLEQLQRANDVTLAETGPQQDKKRERAVKLQKHQKEVVAIEQSGGTLEEKQKRLQHLKDEIRKSLSMLEQT